MAILSSLSVAVAAYSAGASFMTAAGVFFSQMASSFIGRLILGIAGSAVLRALAPKPSAPKVTGYTLTATGAALSHQVVYGQTRVAGAEVFKATTGDDNKYLHLVLAFTGHEIESFEDIWINDKKATLDGNGNVTTVTDEEGETSDVYDGKLTIIKRLGANNQPITLSDADTAGWTDEHKLTGISYLYCRLKFDRDAFPNGVPEIQATIKGKKVYNPITSVTEWSDNPALCLRDYLTNSTYGLGEDADNIDDDLIEAAYNACNEASDVTVTKTIWSQSYTLGSKKFTCNGAFTTESKPVDVLEDMLTSMGGALWYAQGKWRMKAAKYTAPSITFNEDDLRSNIAVSTRHSTRDNFNIVKGVFRGIESNYVDTDYPEVRNVTPADSLVEGEKYVITKLGDTNWNTVAGTSGVTYNVGDLITVDAVGSGTGTADFNVGTDNGIKSPIDMSLPFTSDSVTARRIARIALERHRQQLTVSATFGMRAFNVQVGDTINLTNSRFGWSSKEFEVLSWILVVGEDLDVQVQMELRETAASTFDEVDDAVVYERDNTTLFSPFEVPTVTVNAPTVGTSVNKDGSVITHADFTWSVSDASRISYYLFEYSFDGTNYNNVRLDGTRYRLTPLVSGQTYYYRITPYNYLGVQGTPVDGATGVDPADDDTIPNAPTGVVVVGGYRTATVYWTEPTENTDSSDFTDLLHYEVYRGTTTNPTTLIARVAASRFTDGDLADGTTYYYRVKAVDRSTNKSDYSTNGNGTTQNQLVDGTNVATVYLFNKNTSNSSAPSDPSGTFTYTFSSGALSGGTFNGWTQAPPSLSEGEYLWVIVATASSNTATDSIPASEFSDATIYGQGTAAYRAAVVTLFQKNTDDTTAPADPSGTFTYTFSTGALTGGTLNGWTLSAPSLDKGEYLWSISATAFAQADTDSIAASEFSAAVISGIGGEDGPTGASTNIIFKRSATAPSAPADSAGVPSGWYDNPPSGTDTLWASSGVKVVDATNFDWGTPFQVEGEAVAEVSIYRKNSNAGTLTGTYDFTTQTLTPPSNWTTAVPALSDDGDIIYRATGIASGAPTATAATVTFGTAVIYAQRLDGQAAVSKTLQYDDLQTGGDVTAAGQYKISNSDTATKTDQGTNSWTTSTQSLFIHKTDDNADQSSYLDQLAIGDYLTFTHSDKAGGRATFKITSTPTLASSVYTIRGTTTYADGLDSISTSNGRDAFFGFSRGNTGAQGPDGDTGDTVVTGKVYYTTLQSSAPSTPSATSFNTGTGLFTGLTLGWSRTQPSVEITDTTVFEWSSDFVVTISGVDSSQTITFTSPSSAIQVTTDLESDNYSAGSSGWHLERDTGDIEVNEGTFRGDVLIGDLAVSADMTPTSGSGARIEADGDVAFGDYEKYVRYDVSSGELEIRGEVINFKDSFFNGNEGTWGSINASQTDLSNVLDGAGIYVFAIIGNGADGAGASHSDNTNVGGGGGGGGGVAIVGYEWDGTTALACTMSKNSGAASNAYYNNTSAGSRGGSFTFSVGGSTVLTITGAQGGRQAKYNAEGNNQLNGGDGGVVSGNWVNDNNLINSYFQDGGTGGSSSYDNDGDHSRGGGGGAVDVGQIVQNNSNLNAANGLYGGRGIGNNNDNDVSSGGGASIWGHGRGGTSDHTQVSANSPMSGIGISTGANYFGISPSSIYGGTPRRTASQNGEAGGTFSGGSGGFGATITSNVDNPVRVAKGGAGGSYGGGGGGGSSLGGSTDDSSSTGGVSGGTGVILWYKL